MKSILFGDSKIIGKVYPKPIIDILKREAGLNPEVIENQDLPDQHLDTSDIEYIFTTWGMPQLNAEEIHIPQTAYRLRNMLLPRYFLPIKTSTPAPVILRQETINRQEKRQNRLAEIMDVRQES